MHAHYNVEEWQQHNLSSHGIALRAQDGYQQSQIKVGEVVAYRFKGKYNGRWQIGVIRWIKSGPGPGKFYLETVLYSSTLNVLLREFLRFLPLLIGAFRIKEEPLELKGFAGPWLILQYERLLSELTQQKLLRVAELHTHRAFALPLLIKPSFT